MPTAPSLSLSDWRAQLIRVTVFFLSSSIEGSERWWSEVVGEEPDSVTTQPRTRSTNTVGSFGEGMLQLQLMPHRADWFYTIQSETGPFQAIPSIGEYKKEEPIFIDAIKKWITDSSIDMNRIAYGAVLVAPVEDKVTGYTKMLSMLPDINLDIEHSSDFFYQINHPRYSTVVDGLVNRLTKWSVVSMQGVEFRVEQIDTGLKEINVSPSLNACRLELDINTSQESSTPIPQGSRLAILDELIALGDEICDRGDSL